LKVDGTTRIMRATLEANIIDEYIVKKDDDITEGKEKKVRKNNPDILTVFDLEKKEWRSLNLKNFISIE
jgi:hypothetical protein